MCISSTFVSFLATEAGLLEVFNMFCIFHVEVLSWLSSAVFLLVPRGDKIFFLEFLGVTDTCLTNWACVGLSDVIVEHPMFGGPLSWGWIWMGWLGYIYVALLLLQLVFNI